MRGLPVAGINAFKQDIRQFIIEKDGSNDFEYRRAYRC